MTGLDPRSDCWVLSDGKAGTENQALGLAEALGVTPRIKRIQPKAIWRRLPVRLWAHLLEDSPERSLETTGDSLAPPWPQLLLAAGRAGAPYAIAIRRLSGGATFTVQIQNPRVDPALFDVVVPPRHDHLDAPNVLATLGALNRVTPARLAAAAAQFAPLFANLPRPLVAVLIGGASRTHRFGAATARRLAEQLATLCRIEGAGLAVTLSRRTPPEAGGILRQALDRLPSYVWNGEGENPYFGLLGTADAVVVTSDSVSMTSEACATGKPVYVAAVEGGSKKFAEFHAVLAAEGYARLFAGRLDAEGGKRLTESVRIAAEIRRRMATAASQTS